MIDEHYLGMVIVSGSVFELTNGDLRAAGVLPKPSCRQNMLYNLFMLSFSGMIKVYIKRSVELFVTAVINYILVALHASSIFTYKNKSTTKLLC